MEKKKVAGAGRIDPDPDPTLEKKTEYLTQKTGSGSGFTLIHVSQNFNLLKKSNPDPTL